MPSIKNGTSPVGINKVCNPSISDNVYAYPNSSFDGRFMLLDVSPNGNIDGAKVYKIQGKLIKTVEIQNDQIDISNLPPGIYVMQ